MIVMNVIFVIIIVLIITASCKNVVYFDKKKTVFIFSLLSKAKQSLLFTRFKWVLLNGIVIQKFGFV
jgi:hypothetical protein